MLVPSNVSGHIIGKGGETIAELRRSSCTNIMMSKANELFPGTQVDGCALRVMGLNHL